MALLAWACSVGQMEQRMLNGLAFLLHFQICIPRGEMFMAYEPPQLGLPEVRI
jgi:hypothetical protein